MGNAYPNERYVDYAPSMQTMAPDMPFLGDTICFTSAGEARQGGLLGLSGPSAPTYPSGNIYLAHGNAGNIWCPDGHGASLTGSQMSAIKQPAWHGGTPTSAIIYIPNIH
jgi:hypothetical protein